MKKIKATFLLLGVCLSLQASFAFDSTPLVLTDTATSGKNPVQKSFSVKVNDPKSYNSPSYGLSTSSSILQDPVLNATMGGIVNSMMMGSGSGNDYYSTNQLRQQQAEYANKQN